MKSYIKAISYYLPEYVLSNEEISAAHPEWDANKISVKTGIFERHIASAHEFASDMAIKAAEQLFEEHEISKTDIDFLLYCTQSPDYFLPTTACILQDRLGLQKSTGAMDFNLGCSGYVYGLAIAKGLVSANIAKNVLLITSDTYSKFIHENDKSNKTIFGDGAAATVISSNNGLFEICDFSLGTDGSGYENLIVKNGGVRYKNAVGTDQFDDAGGYLRNDDYLYMNGGSIFSFTNNAVPELVREVLSKNETSLDEVNYFLFHQANKYMLDFIRKKMNIPQEKFIYYLEKVGNTVSSTIPIALKEKCVDKKHSNILLAGFGVGYSWGGCLIKS